MVLQHQFFRDELLVLGRVSKGEGISRKSNPRLGPRSSEINCASAICKTCPVVQVRLPENQHKAASTKFPVDSLKSTSVRRTSISDICPGKAVKHHEAPKFGREDGTAGASAAVPGPGPDANIPGQTCTNRQSRTSRSMVCAAMQ